MRGPIVGMGVVALFSLTVVCGARDRAALPGLDAPSEIRITGEGEPGTPLFVEGTVYAPDGETPAPGVVLYVYQTDITGLYQTSGRIPRLRGYLKTDAEGRYRYRTIRPGSYPNTTILAHIHTQLWGGGYEPQYNEDLNFGDDPFLAEGERRRSEAAGRFAWICTAKPDAAGALHCTHNLRLKPHGDRFEGNIRHGLDDPTS
jgi:protocatechuate 3,4-dioxygenase beta subunit